MIEENSFNASHFASKGHEHDPGEWSDEDRALFKRIRDTLPELAAWGDLPVGVAWASYSQDVFLQSWLEEDYVTLDRNGLMPFLAYVHYHETHGEPPSWGVTTEELEAYAIEYQLL